MQKGYGAFVAAAGALGSKFLGLVTELAASMAQDRSQPVETIMIQCASKMNLACAASPYAALHSADTFATLFRCALDAVPIGSN